MLSKTSRELLDTSNLLCTGVCELNQGGFYVLEEVTEPLLASVARISSFLFEKYFEILIWMES